VEGHVVAEEWSDVLIFGSDTTSEGYYHLKADTTYIWLDWFCIPQVGKALGLPSSGVLCSSEPYEAV
jgi:hypothetical protein